MWDELLKFPNITEDEMLICTECMQVPVLLFDAPCV
jgi:hypothetical protein